jgi:hypothetical protein
MITFSAKLPFVWVKNADFFAKFFCEFFKNHNIGPWSPWLDPKDHVAITYVLQCRKVCLLDILCRTYLPINACIVVTMSSDFVYHNPNKKERMGIFHLFFITCDVKLLQNHNKLSLCFLLFVWSTEKNVLQEQGIITWPITLLFLQTKSVL